MILCAYDKNTFYIYLLLCPKDILSNMDLIDYIIFQIVDSFNYIQHSFISNIYDSGLIYCLFNIFMVFTNNNKFMELWDSSSDSGIKKRNISLK